MIPCYICGKDATGGFIHGYVPAPDGQKVGLCPAHNTQDNKRLAILQWIRSFKAQVSAQNDANAYKLNAAPGYVLTITYAGGGVSSVPCRAWEVAESNTLQITRTDGTVSFVPLQHVQRFDVKEAPASTTAHSQDAVPSGAQ